MPPQRTPFRAAAVVIACCLAIAGSPIRRGHTLANWTDQGHVGGSIAAGTWAIDGHADATILATRATLTVLAGASLGVTLAHAHADASEPGTDTVTVLDVDETSGLLGLALAADAATATAGYAPTHASAAATATELSIGVDLLSLVRVSDLLRVSAAAGVLASTATCPIPGAATAAAPDLTRLSVELLGVPVDAVLAGGAGVTTSVGLGGVLAASAVLRLAPSATATGNRAAAALRAQVALTVTGLLGVVVARVQIDVDLVSADCELTTP